MEFIAISGQSQDAVIRETTQILKTYPFSDPDPVPKPGRMYPYFRFDGYTNTPVMKEWKFIELENEYIKVYITPEIGGKIWGAYEKSTNYPFIYFNHVVKFRDVAMRGAWTSGGIEINFGDIGHVPTVSTPVDYFTRTNADGSVSCFLGAWDWSARTRWMVEVNLPKDKAYFTTKSHWYNATPFETSYYHWMNAGFKAAGNLEFVFPGTHYIGHEGEVGTWPKDSLGRNLNFYNQNNFGSYKSYHVLGKKTDFFGGFWHDDNMGFVRYSPYHEKLGKKVWVWGLSRQGMIWEKLLTDTDGQYVELQSGRLFNQAAEGSMYSPFKHVSFMPYTHDSWTEYWYPVKNTRGLTHATPQGAINLRVQDGWLKLDYCAVSLVQDTLMIGADSKPLMIKVFNLRPLQVVRDSIRWTGDTEKLTIRLGNEIIADGQPTATRRPLEAPKDFDWNSEYGLYLHGKDLMNQRKYEEAVTYFKKVLEKNKYHVDALADLSEIYMFRKGHPAMTPELISRALSVNAYHPKANYLRGFMTWDDRASDALGVAAMDPSYRSPALTQLAIKALRSKNWSKAALYVQQAIEANNHNADALQLEMVIARKTEKNAKALKLSKQLIYEDPLNHFARFEQYLITKTEEDKEQFRGLIRSELPHETFLEIAIWYYKLGLFDEGLQVLDLAPKEVMVLLWKGKFLSELNRWQEETSVIQEAGIMSPERVFPFRYEDTAVLPSFLNSSNWKMEYYRHLYNWAFNFMDVKYTFKSWGASPVSDYAPFYLAKAELFKDQKDTARKALEYAYKLEPHNWRVVKALSDFYAANGQLKKALEVNTNFDKVEKPEHEVYILGQQRARLLLQSGRYKECIDLMKSLTVLPNEGASGAHALFREANIRYAVELTKNKKYKEAQPYLDQAETWPENLGSGAPYDPDNHLTAFLKKYITRKMKNQQVDMTDVMKLSIELTKSDFELLKSLPVELGVN
jgi:tetratricopeptide (TPR) repeat protein